MRTVALVVGSWLLAGCSDPPPAWCRASGETLDAACPGPHCVAAVVVDYKRLEPRGYRVLALAGAPIDSKAAEVLALDHVERVLKQPRPDQSDVDSVDDFYNCFLRYEKSGSSYLVVIHAPTGSVVFAGLEVWGDAQQRGYDFPLPEGYRDRSALGCSDDAAEPESKRFVTTGVPFGSAPASTAAEAWAVARRLNLTGAFTAGRRYRVMTVSYAPAVGEFDPESADWYVWIYRL
jgi:hypothetical protein